MDLGHYSVGLFTAGTGNLRVSSISFTSWDGHHTSLTSMKYSVGEMVKRDWFDGGLTRYEKVVFHQTGLDGLLMHFGDLSGRGLLASAKQFFSEVKNYDRLTGQLIGHVYTHNAEDGRRYQFLQVGTNDFAGIDWSLYKTGRTTELLFSFLKNDRAVQIVRSSGPIIISDTVSDLKFTFANFVGKTRINGKIYNGILINVSTATGQFVTLAAANQTVEDSRILMKVVVNGVLRTFEVTLSAEGLLTGIAEI